MVVGAQRNDLVRLLAVTPDAAQIVVLRKNESLTMMRTLRSDNLRLTHRISYLEEQIRDLLASRTKLFPTEVGLSGLSQSYQHHRQVKRAADPLKNHIYLFSVIQNLLQ